VPAPEPGEKPGRNRRHDDKYRRAAKLGHEPQASRHGRARVSVKRTRQPAVDADDGFARSREQDARDRYENHLDLPRARSGRC
jgi:hypothetical protein